MTTLEEFALIATQLECLEGHLRAQWPTTERSARTEAALNALTCARAVIDELARIGDGPGVAASAPAVALLD